MLKDKKLTTTTTVSDGGQVLAIAITLLGRLYPGMRIDVLRGIAGYFGYTLTKAY